MRLTRRVQVPEHDLVVGQVGHFAEQRFQRGVYCGALLPEFSQIVGFSERYIVKSQQRLLTSPRIADCGTPILRALPSQPTMRRADPWLPTGATGGLHHDAVRAES